MLRLFARCLRLLHPVRWHVVALLAGFSLLSLALVLPSVMLLDALWTRVMGGQPFTAFGASFFGLDPGVVTVAEHFTPDVRKAVARRAVTVAIGLIVVTSPLFMGMRYYQVWILQRINHLLRLALVDRLQTLSLRFHADAKIGDALYRVYQDSAMVTQLIEAVVLTPLMAAGRLLFSLAVVTLFDPVLALVLVSICPPIIGLGWWCGARMRAAFRAAREANAGLTSRIQESLTAMKVIKAYGAAPREQARFEAESRRAFAAAYDARHLFAMSLMLVFWIAALAFIVATLRSTLATREGAELFAQGVLALAALTAWNVGLYGFFKDRFGDGTNALRALFRTWATAQDIGVGLQRVFAILDVEPEVSDAVDARSMSPLRDAIRLTHVTFGYDAARPVLHDVSATIRPGTITALVGPTGSGKSTLLALLLRLFDPQEGSIMVDGIELRQLRIESVREQIAIVLQESALFQATIRDNISFAVEHASDADVRAVARVACADRFIDALPRGYETLLGERGSKLSAGERQRLNVARALLKNPSVLILDEPTAALDAATELDLLRNLSAWGRTRAIVIVTHRLSTIRRADQIILLRDGRIVACGTHDELVATAGAYQRLVAGEAESLMPASSEAAG